jgi:putative hydrolase of the HAD superfamily
MFHGIRWILFDAVGTLIYPDPPVAEVYYAAATRFGSRLSIAEIQQRFSVAIKNGFAVNCSTNEANERRRWRSIVAEVVRDIPLHVEAVFEHLWQHFADPQQWRLYDDVAPTLNDLSSRGFQLGIASNFDGRLKNIVSFHPGLSACQTVFVSSGVRYSKPDPRFFRAIQEQLGVDPAQIVLVGDDEICDIQAATAAGWRAIRLDRENTRNGAIRSLAELL